MISLQFLRFGFVGAVVASAHLVFVFLLTDVVGVWYIYSTIISYIVATGINFFLQKFYVMRHSEMSGAHIQFVKYVLLALLSLLINTAGMYTLVQFLGVPYFYAQVLVIGFLAVVTFAVSRTYIFR